MNDRGGALTDFEIARDVVLLALGATGTILSIYNFVESRRRNSRRLQLSIQTTIPTYHSGELGAPLFQVTVTNTGQRNVTVTNLGLELPNKTTLAITEPYPGFEDTPTPRTLSDGEIATRYFGYHDLSQAIRSSRLDNKARIRPFAVDSAGTRHYGDSLDFDADEWT
jgi:hypothetical protein